MLADDHPPSDRLASMFAQELQRRKSSHKYLVSLPEEVYEQLMEYCHQESIGSNQAVVEAIANYLGLAVDAELEIVQLLEENDKRKRNTQAQLQGWLWIYQAAWFQVWRVREMVKQWKSDRFSTAFFQVKELKKQLEEGDRNAE